MAAVLLLRVLLGMVYSPLLQGALYKPASNNYNVTIPVRLPSQHGPHSVLSYRVAAGGYRYTLHLQQNLALLAPGFVIYAQRSTGQRGPDSKLFQEDCYYHGFIEGVPGSMVALSTCYGLGGFLQTETVTYAIQPLKDSNTFQHIVYRLEDVDIEPKTCFTGRPEITVQEELHRKQQRKHHHADRRTLYMRLYVIVDRDLFRYYAENITLMSSIVFNVMNMADAMFTSLNLKLVLVGLEIWNIENGVPAPEDLNTFLRNLGTWKEKNVIQSLKAEMTVLLRKDGIQSNIGATFTGDICSGYNAVMFVAIAGDVLQVAATQLAHELGHSLGIPHDTSECLCPLSSCIMLPTAVATTSFSRCSVEYFTSFIDGGGGYCLHSATETLLKPQHQPYCGNKMVEGKEECDCGTAGDCANDPCCDDTCTLKGDAKCSHGECCRECQFVKLGTVCRKPVSECDLAEYCSGATASCPEDVYSQDGTPCNHNQSYCVSNRCYDYANHCKALFGKGAHVASKDCFSEVNTIGDQFGNCGFKANGQVPKKCEPADVMCGRVQCDATHIEHIYQSHSTTIETPSGEKTCWSVAYHYSLFDIGAVEDGAKCGLGKVCLARKCADVSQLHYDCDIKHTCSGRGVCNNKKNCHCNKGWAPPDCKHKGNGGSIDSGPLVLGSFVTYNFLKQELRVIEPRFECPLEREKKRKRDLAIGLGVGAVVLVAIIILIVIFRHQIAGLFSK